MELDGAKQCFKFITEKGLKVSSFISDRHLGVAKWICETHPDVQHYNDLDWHVNKSLKKKLFDASKEKGNEVIQLWMKAISRHLYWCARSTRQGFGEIIVAKWVSLIRHISNKHKDHPDELYSECAQVVIVYMFTIKKEGVGNKIFIID
jgi:solute carrier family 8 (sodium/calcium exchanger)